MAFRTDSHYTAAFALYLLRALRESGTRYRSAAQLVSIADTLLVRDRGGEPKEPISAAQHRFGAELLEDFASLGLVTMIEKEVPMYRGSFGNGPPTDGGDRAPAGGDGGSGISEVLAHRVLFSLDDEDFAAAVQRSLEAY